MKEQPVDTKDWEKWLGIETFDDPALIGMVVACARWALRFKNAVSIAQFPYRRGAWVTLLGKTGTGKTKSATKLWEWSSSRERCRVMWMGCAYQHRQIYWPKFIDELRSQEKWPHEMYRDIINWPVLFLDDIGAERDTTGFASEKLNTLLGCRVGKWTILTSNLDLSQLGQIDPRIADRIIREPGNEYIEVETISYGLRKAEHGKAPETLHCS